MPLVAKAFPPLYAFSYTTFGISAAFAREMNKLASAVDWGSKNNSLDDILREITEAKIQVHTESMSTPTNREEAESLMGWSKDRMAQHHLEQTTCFCLSILALARLSPFFL